MTFKVKDFGKKDYIEVYDLMRNFTLNRNDSTEDEIWLVEHPSIYTLGLSKKIEHISYCLLPIRGLDLIEENLLTKNEKNYILKYHIETYSKISPFLNNKERRWLVKLI